MSTVEQSNYTENSPHRSGHEQKHTPKKIGILFFILSTHSGVCMDIEYCGKSSTKCWIFWKMHFKWIESTRINGRVRLIEFQTYNRKRVVSNMPYSVWLCPHVLLLPFSYDIGESPTTMLMLRLMVKHMNEIERWKKIMILFVSLLFSLIRSFLLSVWLYVSMGSICELSFFYEVLH